MITVKFGVEIQSNKNSKFDIINEYIELSRINRESIDFLAQGQIINQDETI